jgi:hypothetical protein
VSEEMGAQKRLAKLYLRKGRLDDARTAIGGVAARAPGGSKYERRKPRSVRRAAGGRQPFERSRRPLRARRLSCHASKCASPRGAS